MSELLKNQTVMEKVQAEVNVCIRNGDVDETDLHKFKVFETGYQRNSMITPSCTSVASFC